MAAHRVTLRVNVCALRDALQVTRNVLDVTRNNSIMHTYTLRDIDTRRVNREIP